ncbi:MAG TPA: DUF1553 domain-containing protein [Candidatus Limnocylindrales bacterium]|nr:DUF1553 domain-containing protein [Candidatus Limnocylindrales bacterium]
MKSPSNLSQLLGHCSRGPLWLILSLFCLLLLSCPGFGADSAEKLDFNFQVRPILADRCFKCHGPDEKARKAKLRLDLPETALAFRDKDSGKAAIVPGKPEESELCRRIVATDDDDRMPPPSSNLSLSDEEKALLRRWVAQGAEYKPHWAFIPVGEVPVPKVGDVSQVRNPIDAFVLDRLQHEGLKLSPEAARETLIRRLSFDLRGLPPSLAEIDDFLADKSPDAFEKLVDRLLASSAYGEQQAQTWLDLARYADTYGYQNDVDRDMSPWRDWVIRAFNQNLPYDQFITWQLAGDLLPGATRDQVLATAFNRLHRQTNEGGSVEEEFRVEYVSDRVATTGTAFLGLTLGCARCHDHKYDPVSQKDFYRMSAFFNNIDESGLYSHFTRATPSPSLLLYRDGGEAKHRELQKAIRDKQALLDELKESANGRFVSWGKTNSIPQPAPVAAFSFEEVKGDATPDNLSTNAASLVDGPKQVDGKVGKALRFSGDNLAICKGAGAFDRTSSFTFSLWVEPTEKQERAVVFHRSRSWTDSGSRGYELLLEDLVPSFSLIHFWPGNSLKVRSKTPLPLNQWSQLTITYDGSSRADGVHLYLNGEPLPSEVVRDHLFKDILHREAWGDADVKEVQLTLAGRFRDSGFKNGLIDEFQVFDRCLTPGEVKMVAGTDTTKPNYAERFEYYAQNVDPQCIAAAAELHQLRQEENRLINDVPEIMVMSEMAGHRATYLLKRGAYDAPGDKVEPDTPEKIFAFSNSLPRNRLGLAKWMVDRRNPLTARVAINRAWRMHFGRGLVDTEEDFGTQGKLPTHPELLDWLAAHFMDSGWDLKALHKLIVMSATYQQSSHASAELLAKDPDNHLFARGPKHRLRAEEIRDNALAVSGLLSTKIGGPSVKPYQPEGLWEEAGTGKHYVQDKGEGLYRRSLYTFWRRTAPPPTMLIFDAPSREVCTARRETTITPLQALVLLDDPQYVESARVLAEQLVRQDASDIDARITEGFRLATGRRPESRELDILRQLYSEQAALFKDDPAAAETYLKTGDRPRDEALPVQEVAATAVLTSALMNLDEFVTER